ncbi:MAG: hypothetical protein HY901_25475 [Deltaproteobacteria bacterium]|nr:hypothetical protein [Deltaproteobacteria bacterium]
MRIAHLLAGVLALSGCATSTAPAQRDATLPPAEAAVKLDEVVGFWTGDWGNLVLKQYGETVWGAYTHRDGTLVGRLEKGALVGWWSEEPGRAPDGDAGEVEIHFVRKGSVLTLLGRYRHGTTGTWHEEWNLKRVEDEPPPELEARFADSTLFHPHP